MAEAFEVILSNGGRIDSVNALIDLRPDEQSIYTLYCECREGAHTATLFVGMFIFPPNVSFLSQEFQEFFRMHVIPVVGPLIPDAKWIFKEI